MIEAIQQFANTLQTEVAADPFFADRDPADRPTYKLDKGGRKYQRVIMTSHGQASVWGFVETDTGDIYKAAGWAKPAKHARGNIADAQYGKNFVWTGPNYLR